jgi:hypothetical protein
MNRTFWWVLFALVVAGIIWYGLAKIVLVAVLVGVGAFYGSAAVIGIWQAHRAIVDAAESRRAAARKAMQPEPAHALAGRVGQDDELAQLRRMAGL